MRLLRMTPIWLVFYCILISFIIFGCSEEGGDSGGTTGSTVPGQTGSNSNQSMGLKLDLGSSKGAVVTDGSSNTSASVAAIHMQNALYLGIEPKLDLKDLPLFNNAGGRGATFYKVDEAGGVSPALEGQCDNSAEMMEDSTVECFKSGIRAELPQVKNIAINGDQVFFLFTQNFIFRDFNDDGVACQNPWDWASPCSCQIFKAKDSLSAMQDGTAAPELGNLECVDNYHTINQWGPTAAKPFQFDGDGNMFFYGQLPDSSQQVLYRVNKDKDADGKFVKTEIVNANICLRDYRVTKNGGIFYIGENCIDGQWGGGDGSFFRYVSNDDTLKQISSGWWEYIFEPIEGLTADKVLFYGPDPDSAEVAQWDSACLFEWDPALAAGSRATRLVTCDNNLWEWLDVRRSADLPEFANADGGYFERWRKPAAADEVENGAGTSPYTRFLGEFKNRCTVGNSETFIGGGNGLPVKNIKQTSAGLAYIVASVNLKNSGSFGCNVQVRGPHCKVNNVPSISNTAGNYTKTSCESEGGTWVTRGWCDGNNGNEWQYNDDASGCIAYNAGATFRYNEWGDWYDSILYKPGEVSATGNVTGHICVDEIDNPATSPYKTRNWWDTNAQGSNPTVLEYMINNVDCTQPTDGWTTTYKGMAYVNRTSNQLSLRSATSEQVADMWLVDNLFYYTAYDTTTGQFLFVKDVADATNDTLLNNFEVYHVADSPKTGCVQFDGLNFSNNTYIFGDLDPAAADVAASLNITNGLTGRVQTMLTYH
jgi:hypothetical protein